MKKLLACMLVVTILLFGAAIGANAAPAQDSVIEAAVSADNSLTDLFKELIDENTVLGRLIWRLNDAELSLMAKWWGRPIHIVLLPVLMTTGFFLGILYVVFHLR